MTCFSFIASSFAPVFELLYLTLGAGVGFGPGLILLVSMSTVPRYFNKYLQLATSITLSGHGIGLFLFSIINEHLLSYYGLPGSLLILAAISLHAVPLGLLMKQPTTRSAEYQQLSSMGPGPKENPSRDEIPNIEKTRDAAPDIHGNSDEKEPLISKSSDNSYMEKNTNGILSKACHSEFKENPSNDNKHSTKHVILTSLRKGTTLFIKTTGVDLFRNKAFRLAIITSALVILPHLVVPTILPDHVHSLGFNEEKADSTLVIIGAANAMCRLLVWKLTSDIDTNLNILALSSVLSGITIMCCILYDSYWMYVVFSLVFGVTRGVFIIYFTLITLDIVGTDRSHHGFGIGLTCRGLAVLCGMPGFGALVDVTRERWGYNLVFISLGSAEILAGLLFIVLKLMMKHT